MYLSNYHSHTLFCDGRTAPEEFIKAAVAAGFQAFGFSAHAPLPFQTEWNMDIEKMDDYLAEINRLKQIYANELDIYVGLEIDYLNEEYNATTPLFRNLKLDYAISSIHFMTNPENGETMCVDGSFEEFQEGVARVFRNDLREAIRFFIRSSMKMIELGGFDIVGHVDKIQQNGSLMPQFDYHDPEYIALFRELFALIAEKERIVEINTKSLFPRGLLYPDATFLPILKEFNIPIHVNADSHHPTLITDGFDRTYALLQQVGFTHTRELVKGTWADVEI